MTYRKHCLTSIGLQFRLQLTLDALRVDFNSQYGRAIFYRSHYTLEIDLAPIKISIKIHR